MKHAITCSNVEPLHRFMHLLILIFTAGLLFSIAVTQTALALALLAWAAIMARRRRWLARGTEFDFFFLAFILVGTFSAVVSAQPQAAFTFYKRVVLLSIVYLIAAAAEDRKFLRLLLAVFFCVLIIMSIIGVFIYLSGAGGLEGRLKLFRHYMTTGGVLMMAGLMSFGLALSGARGKWRPLVLLAAVVSLAPLAFTYTRSSWLGLFVGLFVICLLQKRFFVLMALAGAAIFMSIGSDSMRDRTLSIFNPYHATNRERVYMWSAGIEIIKDNPLAGIGDIDLKEAYEIYRRPEAAESVGHMHNNIIMLGVIMGLPGIIVYLAMFIKILIAELRILFSVPAGDWLGRGVALGSVGALAGFQVNGLFEWNFGDAEVYMLLWFSVGLVLAVGRSSAGEQRKG